jgi:SAM-dependent methyltransferase
MRSFALAIFLTLATHNCLAFRNSDLPSSSGDLKTTIAADAAADAATKVIAPSKLLTDAVEQVTGQRQNFLIQDDDLCNPSHSCTLVPLTQQLNLNMAIPPRRHAVRRKRWGVDRDDTAEYWFNNKIHTFGNTGFWGGLHAFVAPMATKLIDTLAYDGHSAREMIADRLRVVVPTPNPRILDLCCGVGISTRALEKAFKGKAEMLIGLDTSPEMIAMARAINDHQLGVGSFQDSFKQTLMPLAVAVQSAKVKARTMMDRAGKTANGMRTCTSYVLGNAQRTLFPNRSFDLVTIMYAFHEAPKYGRYLMLREARRLLSKGGKLVVVDICPTYTPSATMLAGEPFVLEYKESIQTQMKALKGFDEFDFQSVVDGHVVMWTLTRK